MEEGCAVPKLSRTGTKILEQTESNKMMKRTSSSIASHYPSRLLKSSSVFEGGNKEAVFNDELDPFLTKDIVFFIFTLLSRKVHF